MVSFVGNDPLLGKTIVISHHNPKWQSVYAGLNSIDPALHKGASVPKNAILGRADKRLIFQLLHAGDFIDPERFVDFTDKP
jgi:murein DD-endopeptidase MepM/ murein hydrolase activator NlpD